MSKKLVWKRRGVVKVSAGERGVLKKSVWRRGGVEKVSVGERGV